jgi:exodeoxyribonuclease VII large subunit
MQHRDDGIQRKIFTVSELNADIKSLLEQQFPFIWIYGEISNFRTPASGHFYFTLKDENSQINAVMFRGQQRHLKFEPADGMGVTGMGRISVYEPRGTYQVILEYLEPSGAGALQIAFEKLKKRLASKGFFDEQHKRPLPFMPSKISLITSPTGAVVHDLLNIIQRRFAGVRVEIIPVSVQGAGAVEQIVDALVLLNARADSDVAILARGGGSLEDLQAFNSEPVARAVFESQIPIVSAIGHETDYTIADFVADLRAPTPSAAAELVVPEKTELNRRCTELKRALIYNIGNFIKQLRKTVEELNGRLKAPERQIEDLRLRLDDLINRLENMTRGRIGLENERLNFWTDRLLANNPRSQLIKINEKLDQINTNLFKTLIIYLKDRQNKLRTQTAKLDALNPLAILARGYSITRTLPGALVVKDVRNVTLDQQLEVMLSRGKLYCRVEGKSTHGKKDI